MDSDILEILYTKYYHIAYLYTLSLCKNNQLAEDIVSDAFVKAYLGLENNIYNFKWWLLLVCKNLFIDNYRKSKKFSDQPIDDIEFLSPEETIETELILKEKNLMLYRCIMRLQNNYREILILHYFTGISLIEISRIMNLSASNTKTLIHRARKKLKQELEANGYEF